MQRGERIRLYLDIVATLAIVAASATFMWSVAAGRGTVPGASASAVGENQIGELVADVDTTVTPTTLQTGQPKIALIEFSDFQCPYCAQYAQETYPQLETEFIRPGLVSYVFRHFPLSNHAHAFTASEAAECAGRQGQYLAMRSSLFGNQRALMPPRLLDYAAGIGLNREAFQECLAQGLAKAQVKADMGEGERLGVKSTPTFFVGEVKPDGRITVFRRIRGARPYHVIRAELQKLL
jgi:protein-disulfide isomerase